MVNLVLNDEDVESGGKSTAGIQNDFAYHNNVATASQQIRLAFVRKVYGLLSVQLFLTVVISATIVMVEPVKNFMSESPYGLIGAVIGYFIVFMFLMCFRRHHPINLILMAAFTVMQGAMIGAVVSVYDPKIVFTALILTFTIVVSLTAYTFQSKHDFTAMGGALFAALWILIIGGFAQIFLQSTALEFCISIGGAIVFSLFIIFDTHLLMHHTSPEEYVLATVNIYLDIINLFLYILRILSAARN